jgi:hypothetical protein
VSLVGKKPMGEETLWKPIILSISGIIPAAFENAI